MWRWKELQRLKWVHLSWDRSCTGNLFSPTDFIHFWYWKIFVAKFSSFLSPGPSSCLFKCHSVYRFIILNNLIFSFLDRSVVPNHRMVYLAVLTLQDNVPWRCTRFTHCHHSKNTLFTTCTTSQDALGFLQTLTVQHGYKSEDNLKLVWTSVLNSLCWYHSHALECSKSRKHSVCQKSNSIGVTWGYL